MPTRSPMEIEYVLVRRIRWAVAVFVPGLLISGLTAIPLETEVEWFLAWRNVTPQSAIDHASVMDEWIVRIYNALHTTNQQYPFVAYGYDWLAFGHLSIAIIYLWGAWRDPVSNRWLFDCGLVLCAMLIPYAFLLGHIRGIPMWWRLIDSSFGLLGALPLLYCRKQVQGIVASRKLGGGSERGH